MGYGFAKIAQASGPFWNKAEHELLWHWKHDYTRQHSEQAVLGCLRTKASFWLFGMFPEPYQLST